jgi:hypothetical protein
MPVLLNTTKAVLLRFVPIAVTHSAAAKYNRLITKLEMGELTFEEFHSARMQEVLGVYANEESASCSKSGMLKNWK